MGNWVAGQGQEEYFHRCLWNNHEEWARFPARTQTCIVDNGSTRVIQKFGYLESLLFEIDHPHWK